jgi:hypothetical protein
VSSSIALRKLKARRANSGKNQPALVCFDPGWQPRQNIAAV